MLATEISNMFIHECKSFSDYLQTHGGGSIKAELASTKESMCVLAVYVSLREPLSGIDNLPFICFIHEDEILFYEVMGKVENNKMATAFHFINNLNSSYPHYKFTYSENDDSLDEIEMRYYIDAKYIKDPSDWADLAFGYAVNLDICLTEYKKGWELFPH